MKFRIIKERVIYILERLPILMSIIRLIPLFHRRYKHKKSAIGLEIMTECNLSCFNCEASCRQAQSNEHMSVEQIRKFVDESIRMRWEWGIIKLRGGEPTLHPQFFAVLEETKKYKDVYPKCHVRLQTNNSGSKVREILSKIPSWIEIYSKEYYLLPKFSSYNVAPIDLFTYRYFADFTKGCWRISNCNIGLSRYGYYPCSPGASIDRIFSFDVGLKKLASLNNKAFKKQMKILCKYCGHYKEPNEKIAKEKISPTWRKAYEKYREKKPEVSLY